MTRLAKILLMVVGIIFIVGISSGVYYFYQLKNDAPTKTQNTAPKSSVARDPNGPYYHKIYAATSKDGLAWTKDNKVLFDHASVPGAVIKDGVIYLYFVDASGNGDQVSVTKSTDSGKTFSKLQKIEIKDSDLSPVDPNPQVLANNKIRLYFFANPMASGDPAKAQGPHKVYSAESLDGITFENAQEAFQENNITDPDAFKTTKDWRMFVSQGTSLDLAISTDDGLTFTKQNDFSWNRGGVSSTFNFNGIYRTYFCGQGGIGSATGADTGKLTTEPGTRLVAEGKIMCDPSIIKLPDGTYMMFYKVQSSS